MTISSKSGGGARSALLSACKSVVQQLAPDAEVVLFGSRARGTEKPDSDYDLLVLADTDEIWKLRRLIHDAIYDVALAHDAVISVLVYSLACWDSELARACPLHERVAQEGIRL